MSRLQKCWYYGPAVHLCFTLCCGYFACATAFAVKSWCIWTRSTMWYKRNEENESPSSGKFVYERTAPCYRKFDHKIWIKVDLGFAGDTLLDSSNKSWKIVMPNCRAILSRSISLFLAVLEFSPFRRLF